MTTPTPEPGPAITGADVLAYVNGDQGGGGDPTYAVQCAAEATKLVDAYAGEHAVPDLVMRRARLEVASELYHRRSAPSGVMSQYADLGVTPQRMARDPLTGAYPLLDRYMVGGFA